MKIIQISADAANSTNLPIPPDGQRPDGETPLREGFNNMNRTLCLARLPDVDNIVVGAGTGVEAIGAQNIVDLDVLKASPISWLNTENNKLRFVLRATACGKVNKTIDQVLEDHNVIIFNRDVADVKNGGFLILTLGREGSGADIILEPKHVRKGYFAVSIVRISEEF